MSEVYTIEYILGREDYLKAKNIPTSTPLEIP